MLTLGVVDALCQLFHVAWSLDYKLKLAMLHLPLVEKQRWDEVKYLLEVSQVELALSLRLNHELDVREG